MKKKHFTLNARQAALWHDAEQAYVCAFGIKGSPQFVPMRCEIASESLWREHAQMKGVKILTIEDDPITGNEIVGELTRSGFDVEWVDNGRDGMARAVTDQYDAVTLDRMLPGVDGLTILTAMRSVGIQTPVLMLSALGDVDERIRGLRAGGDDYLTKPFDPQELVARLEVLLRRHRSAPTVAETSLKVGVLEIDLISRKVLCDNIEIVLLPTEYRVLEFMMRHAGQTITRTMLFEAVWGYHFDPGTNLIDVHMGRLRKKLDPEGNRPLIQTVRGSGYLLC